MKCRPLPAVILAVATLFLLALGAPVLAAPAAPTGEPDVYFIRLAALPGDALTPATAYQAAYAQLEPALVELAADGQVLTFDFLADRGAVRVVGLGESVRGLAARPEVAGIDALHAQPVAPQPQPAAPLLTAPPQQAEAPESAPAAPGLTYVVSGVVHDFDGTPLQSAYVRTAYDDPAYNSASTDAAGHYSLNLVAGTYHINAEKWPWPAAAVQTVTVPPAQVVNFTLPQRYTISGKVLAWDGAPISGATVSTDWKDPISTSDQTDATGAYELTVSAGTYHLSVYKSGMPDLPDQTLVVPPSQTVNFTYPHLYTIRGIVHNYTGATVPDAYVSTYWADPVHASANTDVHGAYTLTLTAGTFNLSASKTGFPDAPTRQVTVPPDATGIDFTFPQPYPISGTVRNQAGQPVQGATIYGGVSSVTTAADGTYTVQAGPGDQDISAYKDGYWSAGSVRVPVPPAVTGVDFVLTIANQSITGHVTDKDGQPLKDADVYASSIICTGRGGGSASVRTAADGTYTLAVPTGAFNIRASKSGFVPSASEVVQLPPAATQVNFALEPLTNTIRGLVKNSQGAPVSNASVYASACGVSYSANTDATGAYTLTVSANTYTLSAYANNYPDPPRQTVSVPPNAEHVDFVLPPVYTIKGRVTDPQGHPVAGADVGTDYSGADYDSDTTAADGTYTLYLAAGSYRIGAEKDGYDWPHRNATVPPNQAGVDLVLTPVTLRIQGVIRDGAGKGLAGAYVCPTLTGENSSFFCRTTYYNGAYSKLLPAGTYSVSADATCYTSVTQPNVTLPPDRTGLDFTLLLRDQTIAGRVTDSAGQPICGASMQAKATVSDYDTTERNGRYYLNVPAGTYKVSASKSGYPKVADQTVTVPPHAFAVNFGFQAPGNTIQGVVRDNHGAVQAGVSITANGPGGPVSSTTAADGSYTLRLLDGQWTVAAGKTGYRSFPGSRSYTVPPNQGGADFTLVALGDLKPGYLPVIMR